MKTSNHRTGVRVSSCLALLAALAGFVTAGEQKIVVKTENGIPVVYNPKDPAPPAGSPTSLTLKHELTIGEEAGDENYVFANLRSVQVDDSGNIYVLDLGEMRIRVYDRDGKHLRTFCKKGKGPGELETPVRMAMTRDGRLAVADITNVKFVFFRPDGNIDKELPLGTLRFVIRFAFDSRDRIYAYIRSIDQTRTIEELRLFSPDFKPLAVLASFEDKLAPHIQEAFSPSFILQVRKDDRLIWMIGDSSKYEYSIIDADGNPVRRVVKDYDPVKITAARREKLLKEAFGDQGVPAGYTFDVPSHYPATYYFIIDDEDRLFVRTYDYEGKDGVELAFYDVFDAEGRYIARFSHPLREMVFQAKKNKIYCMVQENEAGIPQVKRYAMIWK